jgi:hypothetical protein
MMNSMRPIIIVIALAVTSLACFTTSTQTALSGVLFSDDFSDTSKKWGQYIDSSHMTDYYNNAYRIVVNDKNTLTWSYPGKESFIDTRIEVDATKNGGPDNNDFGIICRYSDMDKFYYGIISSDGYYSIMKMTSDNGKFLGRESMLESDKINQGTTTNHLRFDCVGPTLTLYVNGFMIDQQTDSDYTTGNVGLISGDLDTGGTDILFDNFFVYKP